MNDSGRIRISASSSAFLFKRNFTVKVLLCSNLSVMKNLYLSLEIQRHMVNVRAGQQSRVIDSGLVYQLSDRAILIFFFFIILF